MHGENAQRIGSRLFACDVNRAAAPSFRRSQSATTPSVAAVAKTSQVDRATPGAGGPGAATSWAGRACASSMTRARRPTAASMIQNSQETEKALEELKQNFEATKEQMDGKTALLKQNIDELELQIGAEENKAAQLRGRLQARAGETQGRQEKLLAQLHEKVRDVYQKCGFDVGSKPSTLFMLSELEARLEQLLDHIETMSEEYIMKEEKDKEKKRRERKRQEQQALQDAQQEERNRKSIARSLQAPKKRTGRQVMFRSAPMRQAVREEKEEEEDDLDELKYLT